MVEIPVSFIYNGKTITGTLDSGHATGNCWTLHVDRYDWGRISFYPHFGNWRCDWNRPGLDGLEDYFVAVLIAWHQ